MQDWPDFIDIQLPFYGEYVMAFLMAGKKRIAHILWQIDLLTAKPEPKGFLAPAKHHFLIPAGDLFTDSQNTRFHKFSPHYSL